MKLAENIIKVVMVGAVWFFSEFSAVFFSRYGPSNFKTYTCSLMRLLFEKNKVSITLFVHNKDIVLKNWQS